MSADVAAIVAEMPLLTRKARRISQSLAEDLVQETMMRAIKSRHTFEEGSLRGWLGTMMIREYWRMIGREERAHLAPPAYQCERASLSRQYGAVELGEVVAVLASMPARQSAILWAAVDTDGSYAALAVRFGMSQKAVKSAIRLARANLRKIIAQGPPRTASP